MKIDRNELMEALSALENFIHAEYHYIESLSVNADKTTAETLDLMHKIHQTRTDIMDTLMQSLPNIGPMWCTIKHLMLTRMSLLETAEKCGDIEDAQHFLKWADDIYHMMKDILFEMDFSTFKDCSRCIEDREGDK